MAADTTGLRPSAARRIGHQGAGRGDRARCRRAGHPAGTPPAPGRGHAALHAPQGRSCSSTTSASRSSSTPSCSGSRVSCDGSTRPRRGWRRRHGPPSRMARRPGSDPNRKRRPADDSAAEPADEPGHRDAPGVEGLRPGPRRGACARRGRPHGRRRRAGRDHGAERLRQEHAADDRRDAGAGDAGRGAHQWSRRVEPVTQRPRTVASAVDRLRLPGLQPAGRAHRCRERCAASGAGWCQRAGPPARPRCGAGGAGRR